MGIMNALVSILTVVSIIALMNYVIYPNPDNYFISLCVNIVNIIIFLPTLIYK